MPAHAAAKMKNSVMARSRTARAERLKLCIGLLFCRVNELSLVQEMRSERYHLFTGLDSVGHDDFFLTDRVNLDEAELHFRLVVHDPDARPATSIIEGPDWHQDGLVAGGFFGDQTDGDSRAERRRGGFTFQHIAGFKSS